MLTVPPDLDESLLAPTLRAGWSIEPTSMTHRPVGFGSHHWEVHDQAAARWFVTLDDLRTRRRMSDEPLTVARERLHAALSAAQALRDEGGDFAVAPVPARDGQPLRSVDDRFVMAVYPFVDGVGFGWGEWTPQHRTATLDLVVRTHAAPPDVRRLALVDDYVIPLWDSVIAVIDPTQAEPADPAAGPFSERSVALLAAHATALSRARGCYDALVHGAQADPPECVLTHGEPHPGNTMRTANGWRLVDWDTALQAPPERDLWDLDPGDGSIHAAYAEATGRVLRPDLLELYRLRWDLADIAAATTHLLGPHGTSADDLENWNILTELVPRTGG